jgi:predicted dithiol-disulfide oxidoreductase (DUF899 family)
LAFNESPKTERAIRSVFPSERPFREACGEDVVERLDHGTPDLLRDPLAIEHAPVDRIDAAIAKLGMVVADIDDDDAARHVRKQPSRKIGDRLRWDRKDDDFSISVQPADRPQEGEREGLSVFLRDGKRLFHTYPAYQRGIDSFLNTYNFLDLTPLGRQEEDGIMR